MSQADLEFIQTKFHDIDGWCSDDAAYLTCCLMSCQAQKGYKAGVLEIGVYKGKYLSVLYQKAAQESQPVVGVDMFVWSPIQNAISTFTRAFGSTNGLNLVTADSRNLNAEALIGMMCGARASFISIDGDHSAPAVEDDLMLASHTLALGGIIAVDDFMNPRAMGVSEGVYRFFFNGGDQPLRPFAHTGNKLFLAERGHHDTYIDAILSFANDSPSLPMIKEFNKFRELGWKYVEQEILGSKVIVV